MGNVTIDLDACLGSTPLFEGKQNINTNIAGSEKHAALSIPTNFPFSPSIKTYVHDLPCGNGTATEQCAIEDSPHKNSKPPALPTEDLEKLGEVPIWRAHLSSLAD